MTDDPWAALESTPRQAGKSAGTTVKKLGFSPVVMFEPEPADASAVVMIDRIQDDIRGTMNTERSKQKQIGLSEIGDPCDLCVARKLSRLYDDMPDSPSWKAQIGTFGHAGLEEYFGHVHADRLILEARPTFDPATDADPRYALERRVQVWTYKGVTYGGSCDLYIEGGTFGLVVDWKFQGPPKLKKTAKGDIGQTYTVQMMLYGLGYENLGLPVTHVLLYALPRDGELDDAKPVLMRYDRQIAVDALKRIKIMVDAAEVMGWDAFIETRTSPSFCFGCKDFREQESKESNDFLFGNMR